jgi:hypothetical protein
MDLRVSLPATLAPATPLCNAQTVWATQLPASFSVNPASGFSVALADVSVNGSACVVNAEQGRIDCVVPAGNTLVEVTATKNGGLRGLQPVTLSKTHA